MEIAVQLVIAGILQGGVYALAAFGLSLIFGVSDVLNLAHGEFLMLGGLVTFLIFEATGLNPFLAGLIMLPMAFFLGYMFDRLLMRPLATKKLHIRIMSSVLVTLGAAITIEDVTSYVKAGGGCGKCHDGIQEIIDSVHGVERQPRKLPLKLNTLQKIKLIEESLETEINPTLKKDAGSLELLDVDGNKVLVKFRGTCASCSKSNFTLKHYVESRLRELVSPELVVEEVQL